MTSCTGKACAAFGIKIILIEPQAAPLMAPYKSVPAARTWATARDKRHRCFFPHLGITTNYHLQLTKVLLHHDPELL